jgi:hypothetical protein
MPNRKHQCCTNIPHLLSSFYLHLVFIFIRISVRIMQPLDVLSVFDFHSHNMLRPRAQSRMLPSACLCVTTQSLSTPHSAFPSSLQTPEGAGSYHLLQYSYFNLHFFKF